MDAGDMPLSRPQAAWRDRSNALCSRVTEESLQEAGDPLGIAHRSLRPRTLPALRCIKQGAAASGEAQIPWTSGWLS